MTHTRPREHDKIEEGKFPRMEIEEENRLQITKEMDDKPFNNAFIPIQAQMIPKKQDPVEKGEISAWNTAKECHQQGKIVIPLSPNTGKKGDGKKPCTKK